VNAIRKAAEQYSDQLWRLNNLYHIIDKSGKRVPFIMNSSQLELYSDLWYRQIILKARQRGFTTLLAMYALDSCIFNPDFSAGIIAHNLEDAKKIFRTKVKLPYESLPEGIKNTVPANNDKAGEYVFDNGSSISVSTSYRSGTLQFLHVSEYGKIASKNPDKADEIATGAFEAVPSDGIIVVESTAEGNGGRFFDMVDKARKNSAEGKERTSLNFQFFFEPWYNNKDYALQGNLSLTDTEEKYFEKLREEHGIKLTDEQKKWYVEKAETLGDLMKREYPSTPDEAFEVAIEGAYYAGIMNKLRVKGQICSVPIEPNIPVDTFWDLGRNDTTAIWFHQRVGKESRFVDYLEDSGEDLSYYARLLKEKDYFYGKHYLPHDANVTDLSVKRRRKEILEDAGVKPTVIVKRVPDINEGIQAVRNVLPTCWFDKGRCSEGIKALDNYRKEFDEKMGTFKSYPRHDWSSNGADSFRQYAQGYEEEQEQVVGTVVPRVHRWS
jgi:hypothetical protein